MAQRAENYWFEKYIERLRDYMALREAAEALVKSGFRVEREDFSTNVDSAKFDALQAALEGGDE
jgi:hypothetical protein